MLLAPRNYALPGSCANKVVFCNIFPEKPKPNKTQFSLRCCEKEASSHQLNWLTSLQISDGALLCLKSIRLVWSFSRGSEISCCYPTKRVEYLLMLLPLHNHKKRLYGDVRWSGWDSYRALSCPPLLHFTSRRELGLLVRLTVFWTCVWFRWSPRSALPLLILDGFVFLTAGVLHLNSGEVSAILGSSIITAHIPGAVRWHGIMKMCQAANCLKQLL